MAQYGNKLYNKRATKILNLVHCVLASTTEPIPHGGFKYILCFVDYFFRSNHGLFS